MTRLIVTIVIWLVLVVGAVAQNQHKYVGDFTGGWVNGVANAFVPDNAAPVLSNYDIKDGALTRRAGLGYIWADTAAPYIGGLFPYAHYRDKGLFVFRNLASRFSTDSASENTQAFMKYDPSTLDVEYVLENRAFNGSWRALQFEAFTDWAQIFHRLFVGSFNGDLFYVTDSSLIPARPRAPGQPLVRPMHGGGNVNGVVRYAYATAAISGSDTSWSNLSAPSWPVEVFDGKVLVYDMYTNTQGMLSNFYIALYREMDRSGNFEKLAFWYYGTVPSAESYVDTFTVTSAADTTTYPWGNFYPTSIACLTFGAECDTLFETQIIAPGAVAGGRTLDTRDSTKPRCTNRDTSCSIAMVASAFEDSLGRVSPLSAWTAFAFDCAADSSDALYGPRPAGWPAPRDSGIVARHHYVWFLTPVQCIPTPDFETWFRLRSLPLDSVPILAFVDIIDTLIWWPYYTGVPSANKDTVYDLYTYTTLDDSALTFEPSIIEHHAERMWMAGNTEYPDYLYYSAIGDPTTVQGFIRVASQQGDGITGLLSIADVDYYDDALPADQMVLFKGASIWLLSGFTFTDYRLSQLMSGVGLVAPRGYCKTNEGVYFVGADGLYQIGQPKALSLSIQATVDSAKTYLSRSVLKAVGQEVWWSLPVGDTVNNRTLIWSTTPKPHWKSYSFAMRDVIPYDTTQDWTAHSTDRTLILTETDSVFRWNYVDTDSLDGDGDVQATYRSKFFFEGGGREKIKYIDIFGTGESAVLKFVFHRNYSQGAGERFDSVYLTPNFADHTRDRIKVNAVCENFALEIIDSAGRGDYTITGYDIVYIPCDKGKRR